MISLAVLISNAGTGTNLQAIIDAIERKKLDAVIKVVVSNSADAFGLQRAKKHKIKTETVDKKTDLTGLLKDKYNVDYVVLAGWKLIIPEEFILAFHNRILNLHPGLIPDTMSGNVKNPDGTIGLWNKGKFTDKAIKEFIDKKIPYAGSTVHFLSTEFDFGPVLGRCFEKVRKNDTVASLYERLKKKENALYVNSLRILSQKMRILLIGNIARDHAIAWKMSRSPLLGRLFVAPGNAGTAQLGENVSIDIRDNRNVVAFAKKNNIDLVIVTADDNLAQGLVDAVQKAGIKAFGPSKKAARIESSKSFAKKIMEKAGIPTAKYKAFCDHKKALEYVKKQPFPLVIKADGLALGKGVIIAQSPTDAENALKEIMIDKKFGSSGDEVIVEEFFQGVEISVHAFCDGKNAVMFPSSQDHKQMFDDDKGPNTGGMGTIAPVPWVTPALMNRVKKTVVQPLLRAMSESGAPFKGVIYPGLMITKDGPKVLEFNARFGDPEAESYMRLLKGDLIKIFLACIDGTLNQRMVKWKNMYACCVMIASKGYPAGSQKGIPIKGINVAESLEGVVVFHAGAKQNGDAVVTDGGRVLAVTAAAANLNAALRKAYKGVDKITFSGMQYRKDIGKRKRPKFI